MLWSPDLFNSLLSQINNYWKKQSKPLTSHNSLFVKHLDRIVCYVILSSKWYYYYSSKWYSVDFYLFACLGSTVAKKVGGSHEQVQGHIKPAISQSIPLPWEIVYSIAFLWRAPKLESSSAGTWAKTSYAWRHPPFCFPEPFQSYHSLAVWCSIIYLPHWASAMYVRETLLYFKSK